MQIYGHQTDIVPDQAATAVIRRVTWIGLILNLLLSAFKFAGGVVGNSQAVVADAVHSLSDMTTDLAILIGVRYWSKPADDDHPRGHYRIEMLVTVFIGLALAAVAVGIMYHSFMTFRDVHTTGPGWIACVAAAVSVGLKEWLYRWTAGHGKKISSSALVANAWHHRSDALSSIPALLAVAGAKLKPDWYFLDHIGAVVVGVLIFQAAWKILASPLDKLIDRGAPKEVRSRIKEIALTTDGVRMIHRLRTRFLDCNRIEADLHVKVDASMTVDTGHEIAENVRRRIIAEMPNVADVVTHLEPYHEISPDPTRPNA